MSKKKAIFFGMFVGSSLGGYLPALFGADVFSSSSLLGYFIGGVLGMWIAYKIG
jgi:hypothetical protein